MEARTWEMLEQPPDMPAVLEVEGRGRYVLAVRRELGHTTYVHEDDVDEHGNQLGVTWTLGRLRELGTVREVLDDLRLSSGRCRQCGQSYTEFACGPTHAVEARRRRLPTRIAGVWEHCCAMLVTNFWSGPPPIPCETDDCPQPEAPWLGVYRWEGPA